MNENSMDGFFESLGIKPQRINNLNELLEYISKYQELYNKYNNASTNEKLVLTQKIANIEDQLRRGIKINSEVMPQCIENIKEFVGLMGIDSAQIEPNINTIELSMSPVNLLEKGKLCNYGDFIAIDYSYIKFDEEGNFLGFNEEQPGFFRHAIIHELLHSISRKSLISLYMDSFSEGMTEYFAHKISNATNVFSDKYEYFERVFYMFGTMMGDSLLFEDYVTDINSMKNLCAFTESLGISKEEFKTFKSDLDNLLKKSFESQPDSKELATLKNQTDNFIFNRIIMPYCSYDKTQAIQMQESLFSKSEETKLALCKINSNSSEKRVRG